jgi:hypothetical protein
MENIAIRYFKKRLKRLERLESLEGLERLEGLNKQIYSSF